MVDSQNSLWLARFDVKVNAVPNTFTLSPDIDALIAQPIVVHSFHKELEIVSQYADNVAQTKSVKEAREKASSTPNVEEPPKDEPKKPTHDEIVAQMVEKTKQSDDVCYFYLESVGWDLAAAMELMDSMEPTRGTSSNSGQPSSNNGTPINLNEEVSKEEPKKTRDDIVTEMVARTKQGEDVCYFYLESVGWDLQAAIELMESMEAR